MARKYSGLSVADDNAEAQKIMTRKDILEKRNKRIAWIVAGGLSFIGLVFLVVCIVSAVDYNGRTQDIFKNAADTKEEREMWKEKAENPPVEYIDPDVVNAYKVGTEVAEYQNILTEATWDNLLANKSDRSDEYIKALSSFRKLFEKNDKSKASYNAWSAEILQDYFSQHGPSDCPYVWEFTTDCGFYGTQTNVAWVCYRTNDTKKESVVAVVKALYDVTDNKFSLVEMFVTDNTI